MIATSNINDFKTLVSTISVEKGGVKMPRETIKELNLELGDKVRYLIV